jgi:hypothetical protein
VYPQPEHKEHKMARARVPLQKAIATGRVAQNPARFKGRVEPKATGPLGPPPEWMTNPHDRLAWETFREELFWLNQSHRALVGIASSIRGRQIAGEDVGVKAFSLLRACLNSMGASPVDSSKVQMPPDETEADPADSYF